MGDVVTYYLIMQFKGWDTLNFSSNLPFPIQLGNPPEGEPCGYAPMFASLSEAEAWLEEWPEGQARPDILKVQVKQC